MIGLIGAMAVEVEALEKKLEGRRETTIGMDTFVSGKLFGQDAVLAVCGPGKVNAAVCTQKMITAFSPDWVLNLGVAGAGTDGVHIGDLVADEELRARLVAAAKKANLTVHEGIIATVDQFIHDGATRARIHHLFNALAVEMEGGAVAHTCLLNGVKCGVLRSISDQADGRSDMDYPTFTALAAAHSQQVVENLLRA